MTGRGAAGRRQLRRRGRHVRRARRDAAVHERSRTKVRPRSRPRCGGRARTTELAEEPSGRDRRGVGMAAKGSPRQGDGRPRGAGRAPELEAQHGRSQGRASAVASALVPGVARRTPRRSGDLARIVVAGRDEDARPDRLARDAVRRRDRVRAWPARGIEPARDGARYDRGVARAILETYEDELARARPGGDGFEVKT